MTLFAERPEPSVPYPCAHGTMQRFPTGWFCAELECRADWSTWVEQVDKIDREWDRTHQYVVEHREYGECARFTDDEWAWLMRQRPETT